VSEIGWMSAIDAVEHNGQQLEPYPPRTSGQRRTASKTGVMRANTQTKCTNKTQVLRKLVQQY